MGYELKSLRREFRITQGELAGEIGVHASVLGAWERSKRNLAVCQPYFNEKLESFFFGDDEDV